jgi:hypothetical protein
MLEKRNDIYFFLSFTTSLKYMLIMRTIIFSCNNLMHHHTQKQTYFQKKSNPCMLGVGFLVWLPKNYNFSFILLIYQDHSKCKPTNISRLENIFLSIYDLPELHKSQGK